MLNRRTFFIREQVGMLKLKGAYDILDPDTQQQLGKATETTPGWALAMRMVLKKQMLPMRVDVRDAQDAQMLSITRGWTFFRSKVHVNNAQNEPIGYFKSKLFSFGGGFHVYGMDNVKVAEIKGNWRGKDFKFVNSTGQELGSVNKKWAGLGKELFTTADNYLITLNDNGDMQQASSALLLAAGLAIDTVYKEK